MKDQCKTLRRLFKSRPNQRIPLYEITRIAAQYNTRIKEIRENKENPMEIINEKSGQKLGGIHGLSTCRQ